jgi:hypothetical protein
MLKNVSHRQQRQRGCDDFEKVGGTTNNLVRNKNLSLFQHTAPNKHGYKFNFLLQFKLPATSLSLRRQPCLKVTRMTLIRLISNDLSNFQNST